MAIQQWFRYLIILSMGLCLIAGITAAAKPDKELEPKFIKKCETECRKSCIQPCCPNCVCPPNDDCLANCKNQCE